MSEKIVQFNVEIIKGQIKELVRGSVEETLNELHACSKKFEFYCLTSREPLAPLFSYACRSLDLQKLVSRFQPGVHVVEGLGVRCNDRMIPLAVRAERPLQSPLKLRCLSR